MATFRSGIQPTVGSIELLETSLPGYIDAPHAPVDKQVSAASTCRGFKQSIGPEPIYLQARSRPAAICML